MSADSLPLVGDVDWLTFREHGKEFLEALQSLESPLPAQTQTAIRKLLDEKNPKEPRQVATAVQKLLDEHCLIGVHINPESRVKAARGARTAELTSDRTTYVLLRVHNEGGVTHPLSVVSDQAIVAGKKDADRWLELNVLNAKPFVNRLSGRTLEYRVLRVIARQSGKREATLVFDVGQGTQDLGFRAEVPILFHVRKP